jgi:hypothetical protein
VPSFALRDLASAAAPSASALVGWNVRSPPVVVLASTIHLCRDSFHLMNGQVFVSSDFVGRIFMGFAFFQLALYWH